MVDFYHRDNLHHIPDFNAGTFGMMSFLGYLSIKHCRRHPTKGRVIVCCAGVPICFPEILTVWGVRHLERRHWKCGLCTLKGVSESFRDFFFFLAWRLFFFLSFVKILMLFKSSFCWHLLQWFKSSPKLHYWYHSTDQSHGFKLHFMLWYSAA